MKKTISINIAGIIFHIDEDAYDKLKAYLDSINRYFSTFEDSAEIISDIENRIAEIFLAKLAEGRQTVNIDDVTDLMATMGTTRDFDATLEGTEPEKKEEPAPKAPEAEQSSTFGSGEIPPGKKLYRDERRKMLGGVAAGMANYFGIDPLWIRLIILILFVNVFFGGLSGAVFLAYIILWIVLPASSVLEEDKKIKKLFRNPDERVLGGVAGGIASYFGADTAVIRLLFVLSIFLGGTGIIVYIILWIITPEAKTITEKMQMQGEPVTLSNIEDNVKRSLNVQGEEEKPLVKVLLFPFRLIALIIEALGKILGPILRVVVDVLRIVAGTIIIIIGFALLVTFIIVVIAAAGIGNWEGLLHLGDIPLEVLQESLMVWPTVAFVLLTVIPALALCLLGISIILKRSVTRPYIGWSLFGLWMLGLIIGSIAFSALAKEFVTENKIKTETTYQMPETTPTLRIKPGNNEYLRLVDLRVRGHEDSTFLLVLDVSSRGRTREEAATNAAMIGYAVEQVGSDFYFGLNPTFPAGSKFRFQEVDATFYVPFGQPFKMDYDLHKILRYTLEPNGYWTSDLRDNEWIFDEDGLRCTTCEEDRKQRTIGRGQRTDLDEMTYPFDQFDEISISSLLEVEIIKGDSFSVTVRGSDSDLEEVFLNQIGGELEVKYRHDNWKWWKDQGSDEVELIITMPELTKFTASGKCTGEIRGFDNEELTVSLTGASEMFISTNTRNLTVQLTGASKTELQGTTERLEADLVGASELKGFDLEATEAMVNAVGASNAEVYASEELSIKSAGVSKIRYRGTDNVDISQMGMGSVKKD